MSTKLTLLNNTTPLLWKKFMPRLHEIGHIIQDQYFALQVYDDNIDFKSFVVIQMLLILTLKKPKT